MKKQQTDDFLSYLNRLNRDALQNYLENLREPVWECELIRIAFPDADLSSGSALEIYRWHFVLFHVLYELVPVFAELNSYLHIHFMRTCVRKYPAAGRCRYFDDEQVEFCAALCSNDAQFCDFHQARLTSRLISSFIAAASINAEISIRPDCFSVAKSKLPG